MSRGTQNSRTRQTSLRTWRTSNKRTTRRCRRLRRSWRTRRIAKGRDPRIGWTLRIKTIERGPGLGQWPSPTSRNIKMKSKMAEMGLTGRVRWKRANRRDWRQSMRRGRNKMTPRTEAPSNDRYRPTRDGRWCQGKWTDSTLLPNRSSSSHPAPSSKSLRISRASWMNRGEPTCSLETKDILGIKTTIGSSRSSSNRKWLITDSHQSKTSPSSWEPRARTRATSPATMKGQVWGAIWPKSRSCLRTSITQVPETTQVPHLPAVSLPTITWWETNMIATSAATSTNGLTTQWLNQLRTNTVPCKRGCNDSSSPGNNTKGNTTTKIHISKTTQTAGRTFISRLLTGKDRERATGWDTQGVAA